MNHHNFNRRIVIWTLVLGLCVVLTSAIFAARGCRSESSSSPIANSGEQARLGLSRVAPDQSYDTVKELLAGPGTHEFTIATSHGDLLCVAYAFVHPAVRFYFLFENDRLTRVVRSPAFANDIVTKPGGRRVSFLRPVDPDARLQEVLEAENLVGRDLQSAVFGQSGEKRKAPPSNLGPAALLVGLVNALGRAEIDAQYKRNAQLQQQFDAFAIRLGMTPGDVEQRLGQPQSTQLRGDNVMVSTYGKDEDLPEVLYDRFSWILIEYRDGRAVRIFSHDFFPKNLRVAGDKAAPSSPSGVR